MIVLWYDYKVEEQNLDVFLFCLVATGSFALDQISCRGMWRKHFERPVERICLENIKQWQGKNITFI